MKEVRTGPHNLYKGRYSIVFYDITDENFVCQFDNVRDILRFLKKEVTRQNVNKLNSAMYYALKSKDRVTKILGEPLKIYILDLNEEEI